MTGLPPISSRDAASDGPPNRRALPDLRSLEAFVAVSESGSMASAASRLKVSPSAVSQLVRSLEVAYGVALFDREVRPARLTSAGRSLLDMAATLLTQARALADELRSGGRQDYGTLRLGCVDSFAATVGPALIRALAGSARQLQLWSGLTPTLAAQLQARELDLAVCTDSGMQDIRVTQQLLFSEAWVAVFPRTQAVREIESAAGLQAVAAGLPLIRYSERSTIGQQIERYLRHLGVAAPRRFEFDATDPLISLVAGGLGWAVSTPLCLWQSRHYLGEVTVLALPRIRLGRRDFFLLTRAGEWEEIGRDVRRVTRTVLTQDTSRAIHRAMPMLAEDVISYPEVEASHR